MTTYHQLTNAQTKAWLLEGFQSHIAARLAKRYPGGCGVVAWRGQLIGYVQPNGRVRELPAPYRRVERQDVANKPEFSGCVCQTYFDPEVGGPWSLRGVTDHHPYCQFHKAAIPVFQQMLKKGTHAYDTGQKLRPDEHIREQERVLGLRGEKTGVRA